MIYNLKVFSIIKILICLLFVVLFSGCSRYNTTINLPADIKEKNEIQKLEIVNNVVNNFEYKSDKSLYGKDDYIAAPEEFLKNEGGDCEDYAIMKYKILTSLGFPEFRMILVKIEMLFPYTGYHMVLTYLTTDGDDLKILTLDNRTREVYEFTEHNMNKYRYRLYSTHMLKNFSENTPITLTN